MNKCFHSEMLQPVQEFLDDTQSQETWGNTSRVQMGDLWTHKHKSNISRNTNLQ